MTDPAPSLYERLGGTYGIAGAVDVLADRLYDRWAQVDAWIGARTG